MTTNMEPMEFSDIHKYNSSTNLTNGKTKSGGCYVSTAVGFLMVLLVIAIAVGVGLIVHFAGGNRQVVCNCGGQTNGGTAELQRQCKAMATDGNSEICNACPKTSLGPTTPPTTTPTPKITDVRIPLALYPVYYDVEIQPNMYEGAAKDFTFDGSVRIQLRCDTPTKNVTLHTNKLNITAGTLQFGAEPGTATAPSIKSWEWDKDRQFMVIHLDGMLMQGGLYFVKMRFVGPLKDDLHGLYLSQYDRNNKTVYVAATQFQPTDARKTFPCFDEPAIKSHFNITLVRKLPLKSLSNMPIVRSETRSGGWVADVYQTSPKMPTYLLAFVVCDFEYKNQTTINNVLYRAWSRPESVGQTEYGLDVGVKILTYFEEYFDIAFPLPKQDMIAIPDFAAGAMENWGLITYRETAMLYEPGVSSEGNKQRVAVVISHELAHQWFGDLVTPSWWDDLWLNEGFASFVEYMGVDFVHKDWKMWDQFALTLQDVFNFDGLISSHPVYVPVAHPDEINEIFDRISYAKGASIIRMMRFFLGENTFKLGLSKYLKSKQYDAAFHDDLWQSLTEQSALENKNINVKDVMDTWTLQMNYPVVTVTQTSSNRIRVHQQRYLRDPNAVDPGRYTSDFGYKWEIPFTYTTSRENRFEKTDNDIEWIRKTTSELSLQSSILPDQSDSNSWILGNPMQYGYYRVNYDEQNWKALINQLKTDHTKIPTINRAQIINDAWNLAKAGMLSQDIALQTLEYLDKEMDYVPRVAADRETGYVDTMLSKTGIYGVFEAFMKSKVEPPFNEVGMNNTGASHLQSYVRSTVASAACTYGVQSCIDESLRLFRQWMSNPSVNPIDPGLKGTVYCTAIRHGGAPEWDFAFMKYKTATVAAESARLLSSMGCSSTPWILSRFLDRAITPSQIRKQDALSVIIYVARNSIGRGIAWDFFRRKYDVIRSEYGGSFFAFTRLVGGVTASFNSQFDLDQLQYFMDTHPNQGSGKRAFEQAVEKTQANIKWMESNLETVKTWLANQGFCNDCETPGSTKVTDVRIPLALYPIYYNVEIKPNMYEGAAKDFTFDGSVRIQLRCDTPTKNVTLHTNKLNITAGTLQFEAEPGTATAPSIDSWEWDKDRQFMVIHLDGMLMQGGLYFVTMRFVGPLKDDLHGLYLSQYERNNQTVYVAATQFQPTDARKTFPCFDEPAVKSNFNITLVRKAPLKSLSNMPIARSENRNGGWIADVYETTPKMPVYLLAFIVCDFEYTNQTTKNNVLYRAWARPESVGQTTYGLDVGVKILTYFEDYFNITFPLPKQDMIAIPDFAAGAMENWGLITYRETAMLYEQGVSSEGNKQRVAVVISHELAHQWFGDLVTPSWWDDLWLNEGFASFVEYMGVDHVHPDWKMFEQFVTEDLQDVFDFDGLISSHPVYVPVSHPDEINEIFDRISYAKGASIIRMMRFFLGEETFRRGLSNYLRAKAYGAAFHDDLWEALTDQSAVDGKNINVKEVMDTWTLQMNYPVVMVTVVNNNQANITQQRYLRDPNAVDPGKYTSDFGYKWEIPFTFTSSTENNFNKTDAHITWIRKTESQKTITSPSVPDQSNNNSWIIGNPMQYGYYRVNYETRNWQALINQLKTDHTRIPPINRAQIINDAWNLAKAGMISQTIALQTLEYMDKELSYVPRVAANKELGYVDTMLSKSGVYGAFETFMKSKIEPPFNVKGMNNTGASHLDSYVRSIVASAACTYGVQSCIDESLRLFRQWMNNPSVNPIDPGLKGAVYCTAIRHGGVAEWDFAFMKYKTATVAAESARLLTSMGCSSEPWILNRYLVRALTPSQIRKQDALDIIVYVARNAIGQGIAWDFFRNKWDVIRNDYGASFFAFTRLVGGVTASFNTQFELDQLQNFMDTHPNQGSGKRAFEQAVEKTQANIKWMESNLAIVQSWLASQ